MSDMYSKPGSGNSRFLYDSNGEVVGRGVTDSSGKTIYTGTNGQYIGKSYDMPSGTTKYVNADNQYVGTGILHQNGIGRIDCSSGAPIGNGKKQDTNAHQNLNAVQSSAPITNAPQKRAAVYSTGYIVKSVIFIILWIIFLSIFLDAIL